MNRESNGHFSEIPLEQRFWEKVDKAGECWLWQGNNNGVYGSVWLNKRLVKAHRVAWMLTHGEIAGELLVLHHCDVPLCVNPSHLFLGKKSDNALDCVEKGRNGEVTHPECKPRGERNGQSKLTESDVRAIRQFIEGGFLQKQIAEMFHVTHSTIGRIVRGKGWTHVK